MIALVFALSFHSLLDILIYAYNFWAPIILVPLAAALFGTKATYKTFLIGAAGGFTGVILWNRWLHQPAGIDGLVIGVFTNAAAFFLASRLESQTVPVPAARRTESRHANRLPRAHHRCTSCLEIILRTGSPNDTGWFKAWANSRQLERPKGRTHPSGQLPAGSIGSCGADHGHPISPLPTHVPTLQQKNCKWP